MMVPGMLKAGAGWLSPGDGQRILVVIQLSGGNDGLNTVVPFRNDLYHEARPSLGLSQEQVLNLNGELGLHYGMTGIRDLFEAGEASVINSVGYPDPNRSHFRSMDIWHSGSASDEFLQTGWIGRYMDAQCHDECAPYHAIEINRSMSLALKGREKSGIAIQKPSSLKKAIDEPFIRSLSHEVEHEHDQVGYLYKTLVNTTSSADYVHEMGSKHKSYRTYPNSDLGRGLKTIAELIISGSSTRVYYASHNGFDTHVNQSGAHERLLSGYSQAVSSFAADLKEQNRWKDVCVMTFSEFGRRVKQNAGRGTDHGTANNLFLFGGNLKNPGVANEGPDLENLDSGDLVYKVDYRDIYAEILNDWMGCPADGVVGGKPTGFRLFS